MDDQERSEDGGSATLDSVAHGGTLRVAAPLAEPARISERERKGCATRLRRATCFVPAADADMAQVLER